MGRPTKYHPSYPDRLVENMKRGLSLRAFGAVVGVCEDTLHEWCKRHKAFSEAKKLGMCHLEEFYIKMLQSMSTGQMRRLAKEVPMMGPDRRVIKDADGQIVYEKVYEEARVNAASGIFLCKNILGWRDNKDLTHSGKENAPPIAIDARHSVLTREERLKEIDRLAKMRKKLGDD